MTECVERVEPIFNRVVIFDNTETSYHGVPVCNGNRKSYLMSLLRDIDNPAEVRPKALFVKRPYEEDGEMIDKLSKIRSELNDY